MLNYQTACRFIKMSVLYLPLIAPFHNWSMQPDDLDEFHRDVIEALFDGMTRAAIKEVSQLLAEYTVAATELFSQAAAVAATPRARSPPTPIIRSQGGRRSPVFYPSRHTSWQ